jgi:SAM-dependent methyltransferase
LNLSRHLRYHSYPDFLLRQPSLIGLIHGWNYMVLQRNWVARRGLRKLLVELASGSLVLDAGCGDGQHILPLARKFPGLQFWGYDKNNDNIAFCKKFTQDSGGFNLHFFLENLEEMNLEGAAAIILCIGTLQYIPNDENVLQNFREALKPSGTLLLYVPVNGRTVLPFYPYFFEKLSHYEKSQNRQRIYLPEEVFEKVESAGFKVKQRRFTYGPLGIAGHEIYSLLLMGIGNAGSWAWVFALGLIALLPVILILKGVDFVIPKKNGNGLLLTAVKVDGQN